MEDERTVVKDGSPDHSDDNMLDRTVEKDKITDKSVNNRADTGRKTSDPLDRDVDAECSWTPRGMTSRCAIAWRPSNGWRCCVTRMRVNLANDQHRRGLRRICTDQCLPLEWRITYMVRQIRRHLVQRYT